MQQEALKFKALGNAEFKLKNFEKAIEHYTKAIELDDTNHVFFSNRSGCYTSLKKWSESLQDAEKCIQVKPDWHKGYIRKAQVYEGQGMWA